MTLLQIVRAAIHDADRRLAEHILWSRTAFPCGKLNAQMIYRAAARWQRAKRNGIQLCDLCDRPAVEHDLCAQCAKALEGAREKRG